MQISTGLRTVILTIFTAVSSSGCLKPLKISPGGNNMNHDDKTAAIQLGPHSYEVKTLFKESFEENKGNWLTDANPGATWEYDDSSLLGSWRQGGSVTWLKPVFKGDILVSVNAETLMPTEEQLDIFARGFRRKRFREGGKNLNLFILCSGPEGENMFDCYKPLLKQGTGPNGMGEDQYNGYFFTWTLGWARFRYLPGYAKASEWSGKGYKQPEIGKIHNIVALRMGNHIRYYIDGRLVHDYEDSKPHEQGQIGFCLWRNSARIHDLTVYRIKDCSSAPEK